MCPCFFPQAKLKRNHQSLFSLSKWKISSAGSFLWPYFYFEARKWTDDTTARVFWPFFIYSYVVIWRIFLAKWNTYTRAANLCCCSNNPILSDKSLFLLFFYFYEPILIQLIIIQDRHQSQIIRKTDRLPGFKGSWKYWQESQRFNSRLKLAW